MRGARSEREEAYKISTSTSASEGNEADEPYCEAERRRLAQLVEHHLHTVGVAGSSPAAATKSLLVRRVSHSDPFKAHVHNRVALPLLVIKVPPLRGVNGEAVALHRLTQELPVPALQ